VRRLVECRRTGRDRGVEGLRGRPRSVARTRFARSSTSTSISATGGCGHGELIQEAFRVGLYRHGTGRPERMTTEEVDTITPRRSSTSAVVRAEGVFASQLSQFMTRRTPSPSHSPRRLSALAQVGLTRERAPIEVRDVHPTHYGPPWCPIETPKAEHRSDRVARLVSTVSSSASSRRRTVVRAAR